MAHNLTITVSEELWTGIERWRDRLPISRICQEALAREVAIFEKLPQEVSEIERLIERLRAEKVDHRAQCYRNGVEAGISWAKVASYPELQDMADTASRNLVLDHWMLPGGEEVDDQLVDEPRYQRGWLDGVLKVWKIVKDKI